MKIRHTPLPANVEYMLDGALDSNEIDGCTSSVLRLYGDPERLDAIGGPPITADEMVRRFEANRNELESLAHKNARERIERANKLMAHADEILIQLEPQRRGALIHDGFRSFKYQINRLCEVMSDWALVDTIEGGSLEPFKPNKDILLDRRGNPYHRTLRMLCSPSFIRRYVKKIHCEEILSMRKSTNVQTARLNMVPKEYIRHDEAIWADMDKQLAAFREHRAREVAEEERMLYSPENFGWEKKPAMDPKRKKLLKRASKIASSVLGGQAVSALGRGEKIKVEGPSLTIQMQKRGLLSDIGHGVLDVSVLDNSGIRLADLCIYQDDIPAIDQAVGFALMVQSGMEKELIDESNIIRTTQAGQENEMIISRTAMESAYRDASRVLGFTDMRGRWTYEQNRQWCRRYWEMTRHLWMETVIVAVAGRNWKTIKELV